MKQKVFLLLFFSLIYVQISFALPKENQYDSLSAIQQIDSFFSDTSCSHTGVFSIIEIMPEYDNSINGLDNWIGRNLRYPRFSQENEIQGQVLIDFIVDREGNVRCPKLIKSSHPDLTLEAIRLFKTMKKWKPGMQSGENVDCIRNFHVNFRLL